MAARYHFAGTNHPVGTGRDLSLQRIVNFRDLSLQRIVNFRDLSLQRIVNFRDLSLQRIVNFRDLSLRHIFTPALRMGLGRSAVLLPAICYLLSLLACTPQKATMDEWPILPPGDNEQYWLCNTVTTDTSGHDTHLSILLTCFDVNGLVTTSMFLTQWSESGFQYGYRVIPNATWTNAKKWPLQVILPGDSSTTDWRFRLDRRSLLVDAAFNGQPFHAEGSFPVKRAFDVWSAPENSSIRLIPAIPMAWKQGKSTTMLHFATLLERPTNLSAPATLIWIDLDLPGKGQVTALLEQTSPDDYDILGGYYVDSTGKSREIPYLGLGPSIDLAGLWRSPKSRRIYPLKFYLPAEGGIHIVPKIQAQELPLGRNSFWMGAMTARDYRDSLVAKGNMYVLGTKQ